MGHHLHVCPKGSRELRRHIALRDYLRTHPEAAADYAVLKRELAGRFFGDVDAYSEAKTEFVEDVLALTGTYQKPRRTDFPAGR